MRDLIARSDLGRYAGQFVWLEMNFDAPQNHAFFTKYGVRSTPTFLMVDAQSESVAEIQPGAMSLEELKQFFHRGIARVSSVQQTSADRALKRGDGLRAQHPAEAAREYEQALRIAPTNWRDRELAEASLAEALSDSKQPQPCAETATSAAPQMARNSMFARIVVTGLWCVLASPASEWSVTESRRLEPLAEEALALSTTVRDHRDELYRSRMLIAMARHQDTYAEELGARWLAELDAIKPMSNEERSALDIARVENVQVYGNPARILPALIESERAMPRDYVASLRLAQTELMAKRYDDAIAAIDRGLARSPGALGRSWLLQMKAEALKQEGQQRDAHRALQLALVAARQIPNPASRKRNIDNIKKELSLEKSQN